MNPNKEPRMSDKDVELQFLRAKVQELKEDLEREIAAHAALRARFAKEIAEDKLDRALRALDSLDALDSQEVK